MESDDGDPLLDEVDVLVRQGGRAVRLVHRETGIMVDWDSESTRVKNRAAALAVLRKRLDGLSRPDNP